MPSDKDAGGWSAFLWNSERKEFLGRTGCSWCKIITFYIIFYGFLAGIFIGTIQALMLTLSADKPTWQDRVEPPGLTHSPRLEKAEIVFTMHDLETYLTYISSMRNFLEPYNVENQRDPWKYEDCGASPSAYKDRGDFDGDIGSRRACRFEQSILGPCSGIEDREFGFRDGKPCLIIKLNRIVHFYPRPPSNNEGIPEEAQQKVQPNVMPVHCTSKREEDADKIGEINYYGIGNGFPLQYYPYYGKILHPQYLQPLVAVQFVNLTRNTELRVECRVFGDNIVHSETDRYQGRFDVKIHVIDDAGEFRHF
ncbi:sodium/potassium-transporting ATPase subunit beta-233-like [Sardina pilchardus]|uniref:sodium/potassium-transporting ATPase subunit beta-233-like n=1 Tax=Sardina pilchardus TaxID=27697 RepID=UPI002E16831B